MRQIILDTETTGLEPAEGHRIIEIGCLEIINRRFTDVHYHQYINPERSVDAGALAVHGIKEDFLLQQPRFIEVIEKFLAFVKDAQLIIHNAPFDINFLNHEFKLAGKNYGKITDYCTVIDTLPLARQLHPGQRNGLDALCKRYSINNSHRKLHGALIDAELLAFVYLAMTGGQTSLFGDDEVHTSLEPIAEMIAPQIKIDRQALRIIKANDDELTAHAARLAALDKSATGGSLWGKS
jgi:DNA polymerase III subunit epsilon